MEGHIQEKCRRKLIPCRDCQALLTSQEIVRNATICDGCKQENDEGGRTMMQRMDATRNRETRAQWPHSGPPEADIPHWRSPPDPSRSRSRSQAGYAEVKLEEPEPEEPQEHPKRARKKKKKKKDKRCRARSQAPNKCGRCQMSPTALRRAVARHNVELSSLCQPCWDIATAVVDGECLDSLTHQERSRSRSPSRRRSCSRSRSASSAQVWVCKKCGRHVSPTELSFMGNTDICQNCVQEMIQPWSTQQQAPPATEPASSSTSTRQEINQMVADRIYTNMMSRGSL